MVFYQSGYFNGDWKVGEIRHQLNNYQPKLLKYLSSFLIKRTTMKTEKITIHATILAGRQKAWDYYTKPEHITKWNFASEDWECPSASNDMKIGGKYVARMEAKDKSFGFDFEAIYEEIEPGIKFVYVMTDGRKVSVQFINHSDNTEVSVIFDAETENSLELQKNGWQAILNNYKKYTEHN